MISVLSSYRLSAEKGKAFPSLDKVCKEIHERGFHAVDILLSADDILAAGGADDGEYEVSVVARHLHDRITECMLSDGTTLLTVPALATNFPNIGNVSNKLLAEVATRHVATSLVLAHHLKAKTVVIVCGRRIMTSRLDEKVSNHEDKKVLSRIRERFVQRVQEAFSLAKDALGSLPSVGLAIEVEPDVLALANSLRDIHDLLSCFDSKTNDDALKTRFGLNVDWGHILVALDRIAPSNRTSAMKEVLSFLINNKHRVFHAHVSDHAPGAHWMDAPLGRFRPLRDYLTLAHFHSDIIANPPSEYCTRALAIELEACDNVSWVIESREALQRLSAEYPNVSFDSPEDQETDIERRILRLPVEVLARGWLAGVNYALYQEIERLVRYGKKPDGDNVTLITEGDLDLIKRFLSASGHDVRTRLAKGIADVTFRRLGTPVLSALLENLISDEYGRSFYLGYRDHAVHSVYVYLLGWYLYATSSSIRELVQSNDSTLCCPSTGTWFGRCWPLTSLCHDLAYVFESDQEDMLKSALDKTIKFYKQFIVDDVPINGSRSVTIPDIDLMIKILDAEKIFSPPEQSQDMPFGDNFFSYIGKETNVHTRLGENGLRNFFLLCLKNDPDGEMAKGRKAFRDHGVMSAGILYALRNCRSQWASIVKEHGNALHPRDNLVQPVIDGMRSWAEEAASSDVWFMQKDAALGKEDFQTVLGAIALHNIYPERIDWYPQGILYRMNEDGTFGQQEKKTVALHQFMIIPKEMPLAFLLCVCDALQEWHRYYFASPLRIERRVLSALDISLGKETERGPIIIRYPTSKYLDAEFGVDSSNSKKKEFNCRFDPTWENYLKIQ